MFIRKHKLSFKHWTSDDIPISYHNILSPYQLKKSVTYVWNEDYEIFALARAYYISSKHVEIGDVWLNPKFRGVKYRNKNYNYSYEFMKRILNNIYYDFPKVEELSLTVDKDNIKAKKLYQKFGFK